jgi:biuret amidohydrolase
MTNFALLLLDYQETICHGSLGSGSGLSAQIEERRVLDNAQTCLAAARNAGAAVVHVCVAFRPDYSDRLNRTERFARYEQQGLLTAGTPEAAFCAEVAPREGEVVIAKGCVDPFIGTGLHAALTGRGIRRLYLGGVATHMVVESCVRHAADSGYDVTVLEDLCAAHDPRLHDYAIGTILPGFATVSNASEFVASLAS